MRIGSTHSEATRRKMRAAKLRLGRKRLVEMARKAGRGNRGKPKSNAHKKLSGKRSGDARRGRKQSPEHVAAMRTALLASSAKRKLPIIIKCANEGWSRAQLRKVHGIQHSTTDRLLNLLEEPEHTRIRDLLDHCWKTLLYRRVRRGAKYYMVKKTLEERREEERQRAADWKSNNPERRKIALWKYSRRRSGDGPLAERHRERNRCYNRDKRKDPIWREKMNKRTREWLRGSGYSRKYRHEINPHYTKTWQFITADTYSNMREFQRDLFASELDFTLPEFRRETLSTRRFRKLYKDYCECNFESTLRPVCGRIHINRPFRLTNIEWRTKSQNAKIMHARKAGVDLPF